MVERNSLLILHDSWYLTDLKCSDFRPSLISVSVEKCSRVFAIVHISFSVGSRDVCGLCIQCSSTAAINYITRAVFLIPAMTLSARSIYYADNT